MANATIKFSKRLDVLPPYLFAHIDTLKAEKEAQGIDVIDLGVGDPDQPTPPHIIDSLVAPRTTMRTIGTPPLKVCYRLERP